MSIIMITHDLGVIAELADEVNVMYLGKVIESGSIRQVFKTPKHPYTQALLSSIPSLATGHRERLPILEGSIPHPQARPDGCPFNPRCKDFIEGTCDKVFPEQEKIEEDKYV